MISVSHKGDFNKLEKFMTRMKNREMFKNLETIAQYGVQVLASYTPRDSGLTADSWDYEIVFGRGEVGITWLNTNIISGFSVALGLQYGHGTGTGGWVAGYDYINPAIQPVFDKIAEQVWKVVTSS